MPEENTFGICIILIEVNVECFFIDKLLKKILVLLYVGSK